MYFETLVDGAPDLVLAPHRFQMIGLQPEAKEVRPTEAMWIHRVEGREVVPELAFWTLVPPWIETPARVTETKAGKLRLVAPPRTHFNSRYDTLVKSTGWKKLLRYNRCVVFLDGFFEWSDDEMLGDREKMVGRYTLNGRRLMPVAGIWNAPDSLGWATFSIVTTQPNEMLAALPHHRMPAILLGKDLGAWLDPDNLEPERVLRATAADEMEELVVPSGNFKDLLPG